MNALDLINKAKEQEKGRNGNTPVPSYTGNGSSGYNIGTLSIIKKAKEQESHNTEYTLPIYSSLGKKPEEYDSLIADAKKQLDFYTSRNYNPSYNPNDLISDTVPTGYYDKQIREQQDVIDKLKSEKWMSENARKYMLYPGKPDFAEKSQIIDDSLGKTTGIQLGDKYFGFGDGTYAYINNLGNRQKNDGELESSTTLGLQKYKYMSQQEKDIYNYIYQTEGKKSASEYLDYISYDLDARQRKERNVEASAFADEKPGLASAASVPANLFSGIGLLDVAAQNFAREVSGKYRPINYNRPAMAASQFTTAVRGTVAGNIADKTGTIDIDSDKHPLWSRLLNGKSLGDVYQLGMSMVDSASVGVLGKAAGIGAAGTVLLGGSAGTQGVLTAIENGANDEQALAMGILNGTFESLFEYISLDKLIKGDTKNILKAFITQGFIEGTEEFNTTLFNTLADILVMAEKSDYQRRIDEYIKQGYSQTEAQAETLKDIAIGMGWDFVGGLLSGGIMGGGKTAVVDLANVVSERRAGRSIRNDTELYNALIEDAKGQPAGSTAKRLANMDKLNNRQVYQLYNEMVNKNPAQSPEPAATPTEQTETARETMVPVSNTVRMHQSTTIDGKNATVEGLTNKNGDLRVLLKTEDGAARVVNINNEAVPEDVREFAQKVSKYGGENAVAMFNAYDGTQDVDRYINAWNTVQNLYGKGTNVTAEMVRERSGIASILSDAQLDLALTRGQNMQRELRAAPMRTGDGSVSFDGATIDGVKYNAVNMDGLTDGQKAAISVVERLAKAFKINFVFYESTAEQRNGVEYYKGANGAYANNTIYLDINGGKITTADKAAILRVAGHELTHFIQQYSPAKYNTLKNYIVDTLINRDGMLGNDFETLVKQKMRSQGLSETAAINEVVADACEMMLENSKAIETIASENPGLARTIRDFLRNFAKRLHDAFAGVEAYHAEAKAMEDHIKELQKLWDDALVSAVRGDEAAAEQIKTTLPEKEAEWRNKGKKKSGMQLSARDTVEKAVEAFGTTENFAEAGYILPDGKLLDFSNDSKKGERDYDHRAIALAYGEKVNLNEHHGATLNGVAIKGDYLEDFVNDGSIRIESGDPDLNMDAGIQLSKTVEPTKAQYQAIRDFIAWKQERDETFVGNEYTLFRGGVLPLGIDFGGDSHVAPGESNNASSLRYIGNVSADRVINDIKHYYQTGNVRQPSVVSQFHVQYSPREANPTSDNRQDITQRDIDELRNIQAEHGNARVSINDLTQEEIRKTNKWAFNFYQRMGTKSPFFRAWFGDWRKVDRSGAKWIDIKNNQINTNTRTVYNTDLGTDDNPAVITISDDVIGDSEHYASINGDKKAVTKLLSHIDEIIENGKLFDTQISNNEKHNKKSSTQFMHVLYTPVVYNGAPFLAKITVEEYGTDEGLRAYNVQRIKMSSLPRAQFRQMHNDAVSTSRKMRLQDDEITVAQLYDLVKQFDVNFKENTKKIGAVDAEGQPIVKDVNGEPVYEDSNGQYKAAENYGTFLTSDSSVLFSQRDSVETRVALADALMTAAETNREKKLVEEYKRKADEVGKINEKLQQTRRELTEARRNNASKDEITKLQNRAKVYADQVNREDSRLLKIGAMEPVRDVISRVKAEERANATVKRQTAVENARAKGRTAVADARAAEQLKAEARLERQKARDAESKANAVAREKLRTEAAKQKLAEEKQARRDDAKAAREKEAADIKALKEKQAQKDADRRESAGVHKYRARVEDKAKTLSDWIIKNSAKEHVPEPLKNIIGDFLESIDFTSRRALDGGAATQKDVRFVTRLKNLNEALHGGNKEITFEEYSTLPEDVLDRLNTLTKEIDTALTIDGTFTVNDMTSEQLEALDEVLGILTHTIRQMNSLYENGRWRSARELAVSTIEETAKMTERKMPKATGKKILGINVDGMIAKAYDSSTGFLSWDNLTPVYAFKRMGDAARSIYNGIINGWSKLAVNAKEVIDFSERAYTAQEAKEWSEDYRDVQFSDGRTGKMSVAQIMSLYCLVQREQALGHLTVGGLRIGTTTQYNQTTHFTCTLEDAQNIISKLNARQKAVADKLQQFMQTRGGEWGNEISMLRYGIRQFGELHYFPIDTDNTDRPGVDTNAKKNDLYRLLNIGATKALTPHASNALVVNDIFDVFSEHMADMAKLNALAMPILNTMKWYNYSEKSDTGVTTTVQRSLERVYGKAVNQYVINFVKDLNGVTEGGRGEGALTKLMGNAKAAAVGMNLRVVFQQPTSYVRAGLLVKAKYLAKGVFSHSQYEEMMKNSGLAVWKIDLGFFDVNIGTGIREQIKHTQSLRQRITEYSTALAGWADKITWTALWNACKLEVADTQRLTGEDLIKATAERFNQVIVETQVMDSTITRSQNMRSNSGLMKQVTSFMSEPTLTYNTLLDAYTSFADEASRTNWQTAMKKHGGHILKTLGVFALSSLATAMAAAISDAGRDDDEYETWLQKYLEAVPKNFKDNINPFGLLPILSDIQSMMQGYSNDSLATSGIYKTINAVKSVISTLKREEELSYKQIYKLMQGVSSLTALPIAPIMRTMQESYNTAATLWNDTFGYNSGNTLPMWHSNEVSDKTQIKNAFNSGHMSEEDAIATLISLGVADSEADAGKIVYGWQNEKAYEPVYEALRGKNAADFKAAKQTMLDYGYDESDINSQVKSKIRELYQGTDTEAKLLDKTAALDMLIKYAGMYKSEAEDVLQKWTCKVVTGIDYDDIDKSYVAGDITSSRSIELLKKYGGVTDVDAKANILKWNCEKDTGIKYGDIKSAYISGDISQRRAVELRTKYGNDAEAEQNVLEWKCEKDTGVVFDNIKKLYIGGEMTARRAIELEETYGTTDDGEALVVSWEFSDKGYNLEAPTARKYLDIVKPSGVSQTDFAEFYLAKNAMKADVNANGKTISGSKKAKVVAYINAMKLTPAQKDALYMLCTATDGYSVSDLKNMPWHN